MSHDEPTQVGSLAGKIDELADAFEQQWRAGAQPRLEDFLVDCAQAQRAALLRELLFVELQLKHRAGAPVAEGDYCQRFTAHQQVVSEVFASLFPDRSDTSALEMGQGSTRATPPGTHPRKTRPKEMAELPCAFGEYDLLEKLGQGGMGVVFKARQRTANRLVALKLIRPENLTPYLSESRIEWLTRFRNEVEAAAKLDHDHVVTVYDVGQVDGQPYYAMRYIEGESLYDKVKHGPLEPNIAARYVEQIARALAEAHVNGILHRDIKPHNILVDQRNDRALLTDFGLAKLTAVDQQLTATLARFGSPPYMSPEQAVDAGKVTASSDIYSLGATLYHLLTGRPPFQAATIAETFRQTAQEEPVSPSQLNPALDRDVETIILKCLQKEPARRYVSAAELAEDLGRFLRGEPIRARPASRAERAWRWCRRNPAIASASLVAMLFLMMGLAASTAFAVRAQMFSEQSAGNARRAQEREKAAQRLVREKNKLAALEARARKNAESNARSLREAIVQTCLSHGLSDYEAGRQEKGLLELQRAWATTPNDDPLRPHLQEVLVDRLLRGGRSPCLPLHHQADVERVAFSPQGDRVVTLCDDGQARIWDVLTGAPIGAPMWHDVTVTARFIPFAIDNVSITTRKEASIQAVLFSPQGDCLLSCSKGDEARLWNARSGLPIGASLQHSDRVTCIAFSPNSDRALTGSWDRTARLWDVRSAVPLGAVMQHGSPVKSAVFGASGNRVLTTTQRTARLWNARTGLPIADTMMHVIDAAFSPQGDRVLTRNFDRSARLYDADTGAHMGAVMHHAGELEVAIFSPRGDRILTYSNDGKVHLWDAYTGMATVAPIELKGGLLDVAFSPQIDRILTRMFHGSQLYDSHTGKPSGELLPHEGTSQALGFTSQEEQVITCSFQSVKIWDVKAGDVVREVSPTDEGLMRAALSPQRDRIIAYGGATLGIWDAKSGDLHCPMQNFESDISRVEFSPQGDKLIVITESGMAHLLEAVAVAPLISRDDAGDHFAFSPRGDRLVTTDNKHNIKQIARLWDARTGNPIGDTMATVCRASELKFSPQGDRFVTVGEDNSARLWESQAGTPLGEPLRHDSLVAWADFSPQGDRVVTQAHNEWRLWNARTGTALTKLLQGQFTGFSTQGDYVYSLLLEDDFWEMVVSNSDSGELLSSFKFILQPGAPNSGVRVLDDSRGLVVFFSGKIAQLFDVKNRKTVGEPMRHPAAVTMLNLDSPNNRIFTVCQDNCVRLWNARTGVPLGKPMPHSSAVIAALISPQGNQILTTTDDDAVLIWNVRTCDPVGKPKQHAGKVVAAYNHRGDRVLTSSQDGTSVWDAHTGGRIGNSIAGFANLDTGDASGFADVFASCFPPGDNDSVLLRMDENTIQLWNTLTAAPLGEPMRHPDKIKASSSSPRGTHVLTCTKSHIARLWNIRTGAMLREPIKLEGRFEVEVRFSPSGETLVAAGDTQSLSFWNALPPTGPTSIDDYVQLCTEHAVDVNGVVYKLTKPELDSLRTTFISNELQWLRLHHAAAKMKQRAYHQRGLRRALKDRDAFICKFHYDWLKKLKTDTTDFDDSVSRLTKVE